MLIYKVLPSQKNTAFCLLLLGFTGHVLNQTMGFVLSRGSSMH